MEQDNWAVHRKEERTPSKGSVMISSDTGFVNGLVTNISSSGLCAYVQEIFDNGSVVSVYSKNFSSKGPRVASIRWCTRITDDLYRIGLYFSFPE